MMATLSVCVGCKDLLFFLKMKDECLTVPYIYVPSKTSREFENALFFFLMEREIFISLYSGLVDYSSRISLTHTHTHILHHYSGVEGRKLHQFLWRQHAIHLFPQMQGFG